MRVRVTPPSNFRRDSLGGKTHVVMNSRSLVESTCSFIVFFGVFVSSPEASEPPLPESPRRFKNSKPALPTTMDDMADMDEDDMTFPILK
jgi:hypothetical protein